MGAPGIRVRSSGVRAGTRRGLGRRGPTPAPQPADAAGAQGVLSAEII